MWPRRSRSGSRATSSSRNTCRLQLGRWTVLMAAASGFACRSGELLQPSRVTAKHEETLAAVQPLAAACSSPPCPQSALPCSRVTPASAKHDASSPTSSRQGTPRHAGSPTSGALRRLLLLDVRHSAMSGAFCRKHAAIMWGATRDPADGTSGLGPPPLTLMCSRWRQQPGWQPDAAVPICLPCPLWQPISLTPLTSRG